MEEEVRKDILDILKKAKKAIQENDIKELKELSNHTVHDASIYQDEYSVSIAVIIYSLSKFYERTKYTQYRDWNFFNDAILKDLERAEENLEKNNITEYEKYIKNVLQTINKLSSHLKKYITEVVEKAKINKASRLHEHGISAGRTAEILGITEWELMDYIGKTGIADVDLALTKRTKERINLTRRIFNLT